MSEEKQDNYSRTNNLPSNIKSLFYCLEFPDESLIPEFLSKAFNSSKPLERFRLQPNAKCHYERNSHILYAYRTDLGFGFYITKNKRNNGKKIKKNPLEFHGAMASLDERVQTFLQLKQVSYTRTIEGYFN